MGSAADQQPAGKRHAEVSFTKPWVDLATNYVDL